MPSLFLILSKPFRCVPRSPIPASLTHIPRHHRPPAHLISDAKTIESHFNHFILFNKSFCLFAIIKFKGSYKLSLFRKAPDSASMIIRYSLLWQFKILLVSLVGLALFALAFRFRFVRLFMNAFCVVFKSAFYSNQMAQNNTQFWPAFCVAPVVQTKSRE